MKRNILILTVAAAAITGAFLASAVYADETYYTEAGVGIAIANGGYSAEVTAPDGSGYACAAITGGSLQCGDTVVVVGTGDYGGPSSGSCSFWDWQCGWLAALIEWVSNL